MKKEIPLYPLAIPLFVVLSVFQSNLDMMNVAETVTPILAGFGFVTLVFGIGFLFGRRIDRAASIAATLTACFFLYGWIGLQMGSWAHPYRLAAWGAMAIPLVAVAAWKPLPVKPLNVFAAIVACVVVARTGFLVTVARWSVHRQWVSTGPAAKAIASPPDIFYIILDGYGREDSLRNSLNFDNRPFLDSLRSKGFFVAANSRSNYCQTELSLASALNFDELQRLLPDDLRASERRTVADQLISQNALVSYLEKAGYDFIPITTGFPPVEFVGHDESLRTLSSTSLLNSTVMAMTPLSASSLTNESLYKMRREWLQAAFQSLEGLGPNGVKPRFVFCHILAPHPPFLFGPNGEPRAPNRSFGYWDASDFYEHGGTVEEYRTGYVEQATYLNKRILSMVDTLTATRTNRIVILQGDHGSKLRVAQNDLSKTDVNECFPNLFAIFAPPSIQSKYGDVVTPVNVFRILLSELFGADLPKRPDRSWYSPFGRPFEFTDVTDRIRSNPDAAASPAKPSDTSSRSEPPSD